VDVSDKRGHDGKEVILIAAGSIFE